MPRFIDLITECLKDTEREVLQKRRVVNVVVHGGGWKRNGKKMGQNSCPSSIPSDLRPKTVVDLFILSKWDILGYFTLWLLFLPLLRADET